MNRMTRLFVAGGMSLMGFFACGCKNTVGMELRDAAVSAAATFIEQQTLDLLGGLFGSETAP